MELRRFNRKPPFEPFLNPPIPPGEMLTEIILGKSKRGLRKTEA